MRIAYAVAFLVAIVCKSEAACQVDSDADPFHGDATFYDWADQAAAGSGSCMYDTGGDLNIAAINYHQYDSGKACGKCVEITGPDGDTLVVVIVDICMTCDYGDLDLHQDGFTAISGGRRGVAEISWTFVECPVPSNFFYVFVYANENAGSAFQMRVFHHRHAIATLERYHEFEGETAEWFTLPRGGHGNWGVPKGYRNVEAPFRLRLTSNVSDEVIEEQINVSPENNYIQEGGNIIVSNHQFSSICGGTAITELASKLAMLCISVSLLASFHKFM